MVRVVVKLLFSLWQIVFSVRGLFVTVAGREGGTSNYCKLLSKAARASSIYKALQNPLATWQPLLLHLSGQQSGK